MKQIEISFGPMASASLGFLINDSPSGKQKSTFLNTIADEIENIGELLIDRCCAESGLPKARILGERGRTVGQLRMFANLIEEGSWLEASVEFAEIDREPIPKPDIRKMLVPMGPVVILDLHFFHV